MKVDEKGNKISRSQIKWFHYEKETPNEIEVKHDFKEEEFRINPLTKKR